MPGILDKISSYLLFNNLLPGVLFAIIASKLTHYSFMGYEIIVAAFLYYFIGVVVGRFGSLVVQPALECIGFKERRDYTSFVAASKKDDKIALLQEVNNTYRTLCSLCLLLLLLKLYEKVSAYLPLLERFHVIFLFLLLVIMFAFAYRKQTTFVTKRIKDE